MKKVADQFNLFQYCHIANRGNARKPIINQVIWLNLNRQWQNRWQNKR